MTHPRLKIPAGNGELALQPAFAEWAGMARRAPQIVAEWDAHIGGVPVGELRAEARAQALAAGAGYTSALGLPVPERAAGLIVATGHQPELFHPGVWAKYFLVDRLASELDAHAVDLVVDTDGFDSVAFSAPCMGDDVRVCRDYLALGGESECYACAPMPDAPALDAFRRAGLDTLTTLPAPAIAHHFETYCDCLREAVAAGSSPDGTDDLSSVLTRARRSYEAPAGTGYLELAVTRMARTPAYLRLVAHILLDAERFARVFNEELAEYRRATGTRSAAQPFPNLTAGDEGVEGPVWALGTSRHRVHVATKGSGVVLSWGEGASLTLPGDHDGAVEVLAASDMTFAPRAVLLTLFTRTLIADLFIHGVGGARYDVLTDAVARRYLGIELPAFVAASLTMHLPLGITAVSEDEVAAARERLNRFKHNPDSFLAEVAFDSAEERDMALAHVAAKGDLVKAIAAPDADKKALGTRIREVNAALAQALAPMKAELRIQAERAEHGHAAQTILEDRSYPFCLWSPLEVQDKVM